MVELTRKLDAFEKQGIKLAAVSYDSVSTLKKFAGEADMKFPLLSDQSAALIEAFGIVNEKYKKGHKWHGIPHPHVYLVSKDKQIKGKLWEERTRSGPSRRPFWSAYRR